MRDITVGVDIGTTAITTIVTERTNEGKVRVLGVGASPSVGIRRGVIVELGEAARSFRRSLLEASRASGVTIRSVVVGVGGPHLATSSLRGAVAVSRADGEITEDDVRRAVAAVEGLVPKNPNREIIHLIPRTFAIDGERGIADPVGMVGMKLEVEAFVVDGARSALQNIIKCCELAGVAVDDWVASVLAASTVLLDRQQRELGAILLDLGAGTTDYAIFEEGRVLDVGSFPIGGERITSDIAIGLRVPVAVAEAIKVRYAQAFGSERVPKRDTIQLAEFIANDPSVFAVRDLADIIAARLSDVFELAVKAMKKVGRAGLLPGGVVLAGGVSDTPGIQGLARRELRLPIEVAKAIALEELHDVVPPRFAVALGLILWHDRSGRARSPGFMRHFGALGERIKEFLRAFIP